MSSVIEIYDLVLRGGRVIDPANAVDGKYDVAIRNGRIAAVAKELPPHEARKVLDVTGSIVAPGFIDLHVHSNEWISPLALNPDDLGVDVGVTTGVNMGDTGAYTVLAFKHYVAAKAKTHLVCFPAVMNHGINFATCYPQYFHPDTINVKASVLAAKENPQLVRGFKVHGDEGCLSHFGTRSIEKAREICDQAKLPLYMHTGTLVPIKRDTAPEPKKVIDIILPWMKPGDVLAHPYAFYRDCMIADREEIPDSLRVALDNGLLLDLGRGHHLSFDIARRMIPKGLIPHTISSDAHGTYTTDGTDLVHDDKGLTYSLFGTLSVFLALGLELGDIVSRVTINPAKILRMEEEIGTLGLHTRADVTIFDLVSEKITFRDGLKKTLEGTQKMMPRWVLRDGEMIKCEGRLLRDLQAA
jgi:dihydroorotase